MKEIQIQTERVDDIPVLVQMLQQMQIAEIIDATIPRHGNRKGLSSGELAVGWLTYILSESDHRMSFVEQWAKQRLLTLRGVLTENVTAKDFTDDRLSMLLSQLSEDSVWSVIEDAMNHSHVRVYKLFRETVRLDSTTAAVYHNSEGSALFGYGHSKDHRPDLAQVKLFVSALDPLALPLTTAIVSGDLADDPLYIPAIDRVRTTLQQRGLLYVGDSKMEKRLTRGHIVHGGDTYLLPLSKKHNQGKLLASFVHQALQDPSTLVTLEENQEGKWQFRGREWIREQSCEMDGKTITWQERLLLIQSRSLQNKQIRGLERRLQAAEHKIQQLTPPPKRERRQFRELDPLQKQVTKILRKHQVEGLLIVTYHREERTIHGHKQPNVRYRVDVIRNETSIQALYPTLGWRLYVTNATTEALSLQQAVGIYRGAVPTIEHLFSRLKGKPLGLRPVFVRREDRLKGLVRLLSIALRTLTLLEFVVRRALVEEEEPLQGLFPGNPKQATKNPTAERLLQAFKDIHLSIVSLPGQKIQHVTALSSLQNRILQLLKFSPTIYTDLEHVKPVPI